MLRCFLSSFLLFTLYSSYAQEMYFEGGKSVASINFKDSNGNSPIELFPVSTSFLSVGYKDELFIKDIQYIIGFGYYGYGAIGNDAFGLNPIKWDVNYLELNLGLNIDLMKINKALIYSQAIASSGILVQGIQIINSRVFDLKNTDDFDGLIIHFRAGLGCSYPISDKVSIYTQYILGSSLPQKSIENSATLEPEKTRFISKNMSFGLLFNIKN